MQSSRIESFGCATTLSADISKAATYGAILSGRRVDIYSRKLTLDPVRLSEAFRLRRPDMLVTTPSLLNVQALGAELKDLLPTQAILFIGEVLSPRLVASIFHSDRTVEVLNGYGPSETTIIISMHRVSSKDSIGDRIPIGTPFKGVKALVLAADGAPAAIGEEGILHIGGKLVANGYRNEPIKTGEKFVTIDGDRYYCTDDVVVKDSEGLLGFLGRKDNQVKVRGTRVEPAELEHAILSLPGVSQVSVTAERSTSSGENELVAYLVANIEENVIMHSLSEFLPSSLLPAKIFFVEQIIVNPNGKVDISKMRSVLTSDNVDHLKNIAVRTDKSQTEKFSHPDLARCFGPARYFSQLSVLWKLEVIHLRF